MSEFKLIVVTPDGIEFDGVAESVVVRTTVGDVGILSNHAPFAAALSTGEAKIQINGIKRFAACSGGVISADKEGVRIVADTFEWADEIDVVRAENARDKARKVIDSSNDSSQIDKAKIKLLRAITRIGVANNK